MSGLQTDIRAHSRIGKECLRGGETTEISPFTSAI